MGKKKAKISTERPMKQQMSPMAYAVSSAVFLIIAAGLLMLYIFKAKDLVNQGIDKNVFYFLLIPLGFSAAAFLFGAMRSYARYSGKQFAGYLDLGGPVVLFLLVVVLGFLLIPRSGPFDFTVILRDAHGKTALRDSGRVKMTLGNEVRDAGIDENGTVDFKNIPFSSRNQKVYLELAAENWRFKHGKISISCPLEGDNARLVIERAKQVISGWVKDDKGNFIEGAKVTVTNLSTFTGENGWFSLEIPPGEQGDNVLVIVRKEGFETWSLKVEPANAGELQVSLDRAGEKEVK
jgi:hypothetical protein